MQKLRPAFNENLSGGRSQKRTLLFLNRLFPDSQIGITVEIFAMLNY